MTDTYFLTRFLFQRSLAGIYFIGFAIAFNQFSALCGRRGIEPMQLFFERVSFWDAPSLFWLNSSNGFITALALAGLVLSGIALIGYSDAFGTGVSIAIWFLLWVLYSSFVNAGQTFYGFGWEILLLETGFLAVFLGPSSTKPPILVIVLLRWLIFRLMFGAGLIKIRGDECWRDLTCLDYHYETMPLPGPTSWYFHLLPKWFNKASVLFNHFVELIVPFFYFGPALARNIAGLLTVIFQFTIIASGNFSWLNHISVVIAVACFDDQWLAKLGPWFVSWARAMGVPTVEAAAASVTALPNAVLYGLAGVIGYLSINPARNLVSPGQIMNTSFDRLHLVNTYGAFGSITRTRYEVILEGADDASGPWKEYEFKGKPGDPSRMPPFVSPYHYKLDWQMWFAAMSSYQYHPWIVNLAAKLLQGDEAVLSLMGPSPFPSKPPRYVRAQLYEYHYSTPEQKKRDRVWWVRERQGLYLPPLSLDDPAFTALLKSQGWLE